MSCGGKLEVSGERVLEIGERTIVTRKVDDREQRSPVIRCSIVQSLGYLWIGIAELMSIVPGPGCDFSSEYLDVSEMVWPQALDLFIGVRSTHLYDDRAGLKSWRQREASATCRRGLPRITQSPRAWLIGRSSRPASASKR